jgi:hypothetical protein
MNESEYKLVNGNKNLIVCFGGILPYEFMNYLSADYKK